MGWGKLFAFVFVLFLSLFFDDCAFANTFTIRIDASVNNIGTAYNSSFPQKAITKLRNPQSAFIDNRSASSEIAVNCSTGASIVPASTGIGSDGFDHNVYVAGGEGWSISAPGITDTCYIQSMTGSTITTGIFVITVTGG